MCVSINAHLSFLEAMTPYPLQQITEVGYVSVLFNCIDILTSSTQHVLHLKYYIRQERDDPLPCPSASYSRVWHWLCMYLPWACSLSWVDWQTLHGCERRTQRNCYCSYSDADGAAVCTALVQLHILVYNNMCKRYSIVNYSRLLNATYVFARTPIRIQPKSVS